MVSSENCPVIAVDRDIYNLMKLLKSKKLCTEYGENVSASNIKGVLPDTENETLSKIKSQNTLKFSTKITRAIP